MRILLFIIIIVVVVVVVGIGLARTSIRIQFPARTVLAALWIAIIFGPKMILMTREWASTCSLSIIVVIVVISISMTLSHFR